MSTNIFNRKSNQKKNIILSQRQDHNNNNIFSNANNRKNDLNPPKEIKTKILTEQIKQNRNVSKKAKDKMRNSIKKERVEIKNVRNKENNKEYGEEDVDKILRGKSKEKGKDNIKKKYNSLKNSINLDAELPYFEDSKIEQKKVEKFLDMNYNNQLLNNGSNQMNPQTDIRRKNYNNNINVFNPKYNNNNNEPFIVKQINNPNENKEIKKEVGSTKNPDSPTGKRSSAKKYTYQSANKNITNDDLKPKRTCSKKFTYQSTLNLNEGKQVSLFNIEKKNTLGTSTKDPTLRNSLKDSIKRINTKKSVNDILIPMTNKTKENNCFLNALIQCLFNLDEFRKEILSEENLYKIKRSKPINEFYELMKTYKMEQQKNKDNKDSLNIEPILSVNNLREYLNEIYKCYSKSECGDPMETMGFIFDLIHKAFNRKDSNNCKCPSHKYFFLFLLENKLCPHCNNKNVQEYNKDCYMFNIFAKDITNKLHGKSFNSYNLKLFHKLKEQNEICDNKVRITGCNCDDIMISAYEKKIKLMGPSSPYLVINITWAEEFPSMIEILTLFTLIPISESIGNLFTFGENTKNNDIFYIKSMILYGIYHYVSIIYMNDQKRWGIADDKTIKFIYKYSDLIDFLLRNHLMPVGIIYSKCYQDKIDDSAIKSNALNKKDYIKLFNFCKDVDRRRGLKVSDIVLSKGSFNENNENYLNNNYFYNSIINFENPNDEYNQKIMDQVINNRKKFEEIKSKTTINKKKNNLVNKDNNSNSPIKKEEKNKNNFLKGKSIMGNLNSNNLKGGIIFFSNSINENKDNNEEQNNDEKTGETKDDNDFSDFGKNYVED